MTNLIVVMELEQEILYSNSSISMETQNQPDYIGGESVVMTTTKKAVCERNPVGRTDPSN